MSKTHDLQTPLTEEVVRKLKVGDMVTLTGDVVLVAGLPTHQRMIAYIEKDYILPIDLAGTVMLHFSGFNREVDGNHELLYMNPTTSTRFSPYMPTLINTLGLRAVGGKGGLDGASTCAMQDQGCVYLSFPGGACTLYANAIREVAAVEWCDLIFHYRLVKLKVEYLGPGTVAIDAHGNSLFDGLAAQATDRLPEILGQLDSRRSAAE